MWSPWSQLRSLPFLTAVPNKVLATASYVVLTDQAYYIAYQVDGGRLEWHLRNLHPFALPYLPPAWWLALGAPPRLALATGDRRGSTGSPYHRGGLTRAHRMEASLRQLLGSGSVAVNCRVKSQIPEVEGANHDLKVFEIFCRKLRVSC